MNQPNRFGYEELDVWQRAVDWASLIITMVDEFQTPRKHYRLIEQLEASSTSVAMNIAEGKGRYSQKEFVHHLYIARGSLYETLTLLEIFLKQKWIDDDRFNQVREGAQILARKLNALINSIKANYQQ